MVKKAVSWQFATVVVTTGALAFASASAIAGKVERVKLENAIKESIGFVNLSRRAGSGLTLYAFTLQNCKHCRDFKTIDITAIREKFGDRVFVSLHQLPADVRHAPILVLAGRQKRLIVGRPQQTQLLVQQISENLADGVVSNSQSTLQKQSNQWFFRRTH